jgi:hypothetical protein
MDRILWEMHMKLQTHGEASFNLSELGINIDIKMGISIDIKNR